MSFEIFSKTSDKTVNAFFMYGGLAGFTLEGNNWTSPVFLSWTLLSMGVSAIYAYYAFKDAERQIKQQRKLALKQTKWQKWAQRQSQEQELHPLSFSQPYAPPYHFQFDPNIYTAKNNLKSKLLHEAQEKQRRATLFTFLKWFILVLCLSGAAIFGLEEPIRQTVQAFLANPVDMTFLFSAGLIGLIASYSKYHTNRSTQKFKYARYKITRAEYKANQAKFEELIQNLELEETQRTIIKNSWNIITDKKSSISPARVAMQNDFLAQLILINMGNFDEFNKTYLQKIAEAKKNNHSCFENFSSPYEKSDLTGYIPPGKLPPSEEKTLILSTMGSGLIWFLSILSVPGMVFNEWSCFINFALNPWGLLTIGASLFVGILSAAWKYHTGYEKRLAEHQERMDGYLEDYEKYDAATKLYLDQYRNKSYKNNHTVTDVVLTGIFSFLSNAISVFCLGGFTLFSVGTVAATPLGWVALTLSALSLLVGTLFSIKDIYQQVREIKKANPETSTPAQSSAYTVLSSLAPAPDLTLAPDPSLHPSTPTFRTQLRNFLCSCWCGASTPSTETWAGNIQQDHTQRLAL